MPSLFGQRTLYDVLDRHLGEGWEERSDFGRLTDLSQGRLLDLYCDLFEFRPQSSPGPQRPSGLRVSFAAGAPLSAIAVSALHAQKVALQFPLRQKFSIQHNLGSESALTTIRSWVELHRTASFFNDASYDPVVSYNDLLAGAPVAVPPAMLASQKTEPSESSSGRSKILDDIRRALDEADDLLPYVPPKLEPLPTREVLIQLFRDDYLPKIGPLRYLIENDIVEFFYPSWELLPHGGRLALRGCIETSLPFCQDLYRVLRKTDPGIPENPPEDDGWIGRWPEVTGHLTRHYHELVQAIAECTWASHNQATLLTANESIFEFARLFMVHFERIGDTGALIGYPVFLFPRQYQVSADSEIFRRFLTQAILSRWVDPQGLKVSTVVDLRRSEETFAAWRAELAQRLPLIQESQNLAECESLIRECLEGLRAREEEIFARISRFQGRNLREALSKGATVATLTFLGTFGVSGDLGAAFRAAGISGLATVGGHLPSLLSSEGDFQGAHLAIAKLALGRHRD